MMLKNHFRMDWLREVSNIFLAVFLLFTAPVLNMFSTPPSTILSQHSLLTCMARNVVRMIYTLEFHIVTEVASMASFKQDSGLCVVLYQPKLPYTANCGKGTDKKANVTKSYILDIKRIEKAQLHTWWCSVGETQSDHFDFKQKSKSLFSFAYMVNILTAAVSLSCQRVWKLMNSVPQIVFYFQ